MYWLHEIITSSHTHSADNEELTENKKKMKKNQLIDQIPDTRYHIIPYLLYDEHGFLI